MPVAYFNRRGFFRRKRNPSFSAKKHRKSSISGVFAFYDRFLFAHADILAQKWERKSATFLPKKRRKSAE